MKNLIKKLIFLLLISCSTKAQDGKFSFTLSTQAHTSAGVFKNDSTLVRTLWNDSIFAAGSYTRYWDGKDDNGVKLSQPDSEYVIKVVSNNVQYNWDGTFGNSSDSMTGDRKYRGYYHCMKGLAFTSTTGYYCTGYAEGSSSVGKFSIITPQTKTTLLQNATNGQTGEVRMVCTDGTYVYWGVGDAYANTNSFVFATKVSDDTEVAFSAGSPYAVTYGKTYNNAISKFNAANTGITGLAVQRSGNFLFVARAGANLLQVLNKTTGALVQSITYPSIGSLAVDANDNLWMVTSTNVISRHVVSSTGMLSTPNLFVSGTVEPIAIQVSKDGTKLAVADAATTVQQLKFYSTTTAAPAGSLGVAGGYTMDATVTNNKFYFNDTRISQRAYKASFIAYQTDGTYWVSDPGNFRVQHYNANNVFLNRIMSMGSTYRTWVDKNNITRVFSDYLEFSLDYSQPLTGSTGWTLVKNWGANVRKNGELTGSTNAYDFGMFTPITLNNGRTYTWLRIYNTVNRELVELISTGTMRFTGIIRSPLGIPIAKDGSLHTYVKGLVGGRGVFKRFPLTGFDANNNPIWSTTPDHVTTTPVLTINDPEFSPLTTETISSTNKLIFYNPSAYQSFVRNGSPLNVLYPGYHLGIMEVGSSKWLMKTEQSTHLRYLGAYPGPGYFDIGNGVNLFAGGNVNVIKRNIITTYHGEFWKASQTNKYNHYLDNGLAIGQFGKTRPEVGFGMPAAAGMAGNALTPCLVESITGDTLFLYHGDESDHSAMHRWSITGLNTITQQDIKIKFPVISQLLSNGIDLMAGLPFDDTLTNNTAGWTRNAPQNLTNPYSTFYNIKTSVLKYDKTSSPDIQIVFVDAAAKTNTVTRDLGNNTVSKDWEISGYLAYPSSMVNGVVAGNVNSNQYLDVLDNAGKILTRFSVVRNAGTNPYTASIMGNSQAIATGPEASIRTIMNKMSLLEVSVVNGVVTFKFDGFPGITTTIFDPAANWKSPKSLRIQHVSVTYPYVYSKNIDLRDFMFYKDINSPVTVNIPPVANAGIDQVITLPVISTNLACTATDSDGTVASIAWAKISGPSLGLIVSPNAATTVISALVQGVYQYQLTVTDNSGAVTKDTIQITVNPALNVAPTANAGIDQSITLPVSNTILTGIATDSDGTVSTYAWKQLSGASVALIASPNAATTVINALIQGQYEFELTVTDDDGAVSKDSIVVTVNAPNNIAPTADAGVDQALTLPVNSTSLSGTGTDSDGTIATYAWRQISGPSSGLIISPNSATTMINSLVQGTYQFQLTVTDNNGAVAKDIIEVIVNAALNIPPTADAGISQVITLPINNTTLSGNGTDIDGTISGYSWIQISGPSSSIIFSPNAASTSIDNLLQGVYEYELTVTDDSGDISKDTTDVTVNAANNVAPTANAGTDLAITLPVNNVTLNGAGNDVDGTISSYAWTQISGPSGALIVAPASASTDVNNLVQGIYEFELTVTDDKGSISKDIVEVTLNAAPNKAPIADAGTDQVTTLPVSSTTLTGTGTDTDGTIAGYAWMQLSGPSGATISSANAASTAVSNLVKGVYEYELTVTDDMGAVSKDTMYVTVNPAANLAPTADAGTDQSITLPISSILLSGIGTDTDGAISNYSWAQLSGPLVSIVAPGSASTVVNNLIQGNYQFELTVTDDSGAVSTDIIEVTVNAAINLVPTADAGTDQVITLPVNSTILTGNGIDTDGTISAYAWAQISGPSSALIMSVNSASGNISNLVQGTYQFELTVTDNNGAIAKDTIQVIVNSAINTAPSANAGTDLAITLPINSTTLTGNGTDLDGVIFSYAWVEISGPSTGVIASPDASSSSINNLVSGIYEFELTVTDDGGATSKDTIQVIVYSAANLAPVADAGSDQFITLPVDSATLSGAGIDADGTISSFAWAQVSGPSTIVIASANTASTSINNLPKGIYEFELTVVDDSGAVSKDTISITVNNAANLIPTADAGTDQVITLPVNSTTLTGGGTDLDGSIVNYSWVLISGPATGTIVSPNTASTSINNLVQGNYQFELTVTDDSGAVSKDIVQVTVNMIINDPPSADAGPDQVITLPLDSVVLNGFGMDISGVIVSYAWTKISGPSAFIASTNTATTTINNLVQGVYLYQLTIRDNGGLTATDTVQITVNAASNVAPVANAGTDETITLPTNITTLTGIGTDADGTISSYAWVKISGPAVGVITSPNAASTAIDSLVQGVYEYELTITDNIGAVSKDTVQITVNAAPNQAPVADAGIDQSITLPVDSTILSGNGIDADGPIVSYGWVKISGPATGNITSPNMAATTLSNLTQGVYEYELTVTDDQGVTIKDTVQVTVNAALNIPPSVNAGTDQVITLPVNSTTLSGSATDLDGTVASYSWMQILGPSAANIASSTTPATSVDNLVQGLYKFELTVTDNSGATSKDTILVTVNDALNMAPVASAGTNKTITLPVNSTTLDGSATDADGTVVTYAWVQISGPVTGTIASPNAANTTVDNLVPGIYKYELTVTDDDGAISKDVVQVTVNDAPNQAPSVNAGTDQSITLPINTIILTGTAADVDGSVVSYSWVKVTGPAAEIISSPNALSTSIGNLTQGVYLYQFTVTDDDGAITKDTVQVTVNKPANQGPSANSGIDQMITLPTNSVSLTGVGSDADGTIVSYAWVKISGPATGTIASAGSGTTSITNLAQGVYQYELTVADNDGAIAKDTVQVTVNAAPNVAPLADAGIDQSITLPTNTIALTGSGTDADGTINAYAWVKIGGPSNGTIAAANSANTTVNNLVQGVYQFQLTVTDNNGAISKDTIEVTVNPAPNQAPVAIAGLAIAITLPVNSATLNGIGTDIDGTIASYAWVEISGPAAGVIVSANTATTVINNLVQGIYQFELTVTDNNGAISKDIVQVTVNAAPNKAPSANAGLDQMITLPINTVALTGSGTDSDGSIVSFKWVKISGVASAIILSPNSATTTINNLIQGVYQYELTVTDNSGAVSKDTVKVTVNPAPNKAPVANAGSDVAITLPVNSTTLSGSGTDVDGTIADYTWVKIAGPAAGTIASANSGNTAINNLTLGVYQYQLTVTDNNGAISKDTVTVTVNKAPNVAPAANAGADKSITLPINNTVLTGTGIDIDGTIASYSWIKISGPAAGTITSANLATTAINSLVLGVYQYQLTVTDNDGAVSKDTVKVTVNPAPNKAPVANAGTDKLITLPVDSIALSGTATDSDGTIVSYAWVKIAGPSSGTIASSNSANTIVNNLVKGVYQYQLTVTDNDGAVSKDTINIIVNAAPNKAPVANAGTDKVITLPTNSTTLNGSGTDTDGTIVSYAWVKIAGPSLGTIALNSSAITAINNLVQGVYQYQLTVTDNSGAISKDTVKITLNAAPNVAPVVNAGTDKVITLPINSITLSGTATDADGTIANYTWVKISGPAAGVITSPGTAATAINNLVQGVYQYMLTVTDNNGAVSRDTVKVTVNAAINKAPLANAGIDKAIMLPTNSTTLNGTATDSDGTIVSYSWIKVSGPTAGTIALPNAATSAVNNLVQGIYQFQLTVTDNGGAISKDTVMITVKAATNLPPAANAGPDKVITLPLNITSLTGTGTDADGTVTGYSWVKISGPTGGTVGSPNNAATAVTGLIQGVYQYQLTVTDNKGLTGKDTVLITVNPIHNDVPVVNAGADIDMVLPTNSASLKGSAVDTDGTIAKYTWKVVSGPAGYVILDQGISQTKIDSLFQGVYEVELTAWDNKGASASDTMKITVSAPRLAPNTANSAKVYPNPVVDVANVSISTINANTKVSVAISTVLGMQVKYSEFVTTSTNTIYPLNMSNLSQAYYFVTVRFEDGQKITYKILKSR